LRLLTLIGIGGNLDSPRWGPPRSTLSAALDELGREGVTICARSAWYRSEPVPPSDQPWFINAVAAVETGLDAAGLLAVMHTSGRRGWGLTLFLPSKTRWPGKHLSTERIDWRPPSRAD